MKFGPRRGHVMFIFERFFRDFGLLIAALLVAFILQDYQKLLENVPVLIVVLFAPVKRLIDYLFTYYSIDDERLLIESGWLNKKKQEIPLVNITTVSFTQNIFFQLAKVYSVNIDNSSNISGVNLEKVRMTLKINDAVQAKKLLLSKHDNTDQELHENQISEDTSGNTIMASAGEILIMGLLRSKAVIVIQVLAYGGVAISLFAKVFLDETVDGDALIMDSFARVAAPILIVLVILVLYLLGVAVSVAMSMVKYYGFRVTNRENSIFIEYGLLTKKTYTLMKEKISGVAYNQSILMRAFGRGTLEVFAVGYGGVDEDNSQEVAVLYPVLRKEKLYDFLERFLPEIKDREDYVPTQPSSFPYFFLCGRFVWSVLFLIACLVPWTYEPLIRYGLITTGIVVFVMAAISVVLEYGNTAIFGNQRLIGLTCGSYTKSSIFIKTEKVESIGERATIRKKRRKHITTIQLGVLAPTTAASQRVRNIGLDTFDRIKSNLIY